MLTLGNCFDIIVNAADHGGVFFCAVLGHQSYTEHINMSLRYAHYKERYRSGHNEAVLKTVCPQGRMGSNPILSAY